MPRRARLGSGLLGLGFSTSSRRAALGAVVAIAACGALLAPAAAEFGVAFAQLGPSEPFEAPDAGERAARDWAAFEENAAAAFAWFETALGRVAASPGLMMGAAFLSAALGGFFGARVRAIRSRAVDADEAAFRPARPDPAAMAMRRAASAPELREADRVFRFFAERFQIAERSADAVIDFLTRLGETVSNLRRRLADAEAARDDAVRRADDAERRADDLEGTLGVDPSAERSTAVIVTPPAPPPDAASAVTAWRFAGEALRMARAVCQEMRGQDPDYDRFEATVGLEEALLRFSALRAAHGDSAAPFDPALIEETWPHAIFRADALLSAYFSGEGAWSELRAGVGMCSASLHRLLRRQGVSVGGVRLLAPFDPDEGENWSDAAQGLIAIAPIRERMVWLFGAEADAPMEDRVVIDCESFGFEDERRGVSARARLILYNHQEWIAPPPPPAMTDL